MSPNMARRRGATSARKAPSPRSDRQVIQQPASRRRRLAALPADRARRMRFIATGLLVLMAASYLTARELAVLYPHPAWGFVIAFTEAAMVGGLADWFAVTALF